MILRIGAVVSLNAVANIKVHAGEIETGLANFNGVATLYARGGELGAGWVRVVPDDRRMGVQRIKFTDWNKIN